VYIFSELNEKSLTLARDLYENEPQKRFFVFTDVFDNGEEQSFELIEGAKEIGAICFKRDIVVVDFSFHSKKRSMNFFLIGEDQSENIEQGLKRGLYFGVNGIATFAKISHPPVERILLETDAPYLTPEPHRGKRNKSPFVEHTARRVALIKGMEYEEVAAATMANAKRFFGLEEII
jgi:hypothetical protein